MKSKMSALAAIASVIGHKHGVEVVFDQSARTASTNGKRITLPVVSTLGNEDHELLMYGLLDHEIAHVRSTNFDVLKHGNFSPLVACLGNLIEDVWIEREQAVHYPGCALSILESMKVMIKLGWYAGPTDDPVQPSMLFTNWLLHALLARWYKLSELETMARDYMRKSIETFGLELSNQIWEKALEVDAVKSTEAAYELAQSLSDMLKAAQPEKTQEPQAKQESQSQAKNDAIEQTLNAKQESCAQTEFSDRISSALSSEGVMGSGCDPEPGHIDLAPVSWSS